MLALIGQGHQAEPLPRTSDWHPGRTGAHPLPKGHASPTCRAGTWSPVGAFGRAGRGRVCPWGWVTHHPPWGTLGSFYSRCPVNSGYSRVKWGPASHLGKPRGSWVPRGRGEAR